jgi:hypothetical protein
MPDPEVTPEKKNDTVEISKAVFDVIVEIAKTKGPAMFPQAVATPHDPGDDWKPGYKTTEFWLTLAATIGGVAIQFLPEAGIASHIVGGVLATLATFGYTHSRTVYKNTP